MLTPRTSLDIPGLEKRLYRIGLNIMPRSEYRIVSQIVQVFAEIAELTMLAIDTEVLIIDIDV